eukprot:scaffold1322_cov372-Pavlova_lutheri.AAC.7
MDEQQHAALPCKCKTMATPARKRTVVEWFGTTSRLSTPLSLETRGERFSSEVEYSSGGSPRFPTGWIGATPAWKRGPVGVTRAQDPHEDWNGPLLSFSPSQGNPRNPPRRNATRSRGVARGKRELRGREAHSISMDGWPRHDPRLYVG